MKKPLPFLAIFLLLGVVSACNSSNIKATGRVTFDDGAPLDRGMVVLQNDQHQYVGDIRSDGTFMMSSLKPGDGLPEGVYQAAIRNALDENEKTMVAEKYTDTTTSGLVYEITPQMKPFEIVVTRPVAPKRK